MSGDREARSSHQNSQIELAKASGVDLPARDSERA